MQPETDKRITKGKQTRQEILNAAFQLLTQEGPKGITAGKLARAAGISKANLFHHFKKIDDIPFALIEGLIGQFSGVIAKKNPKSIAEYVNTLGQTVLDAPYEASKTTTAFVHFYIRSSHDEAFRAQQERAARAFIEHLERGFEASIGRALTPHERRIAPTLVAACLEGMSLFAVVFKDRESLKSAWKAMSQWIDMYLKEQR